MLPSKPVIFSLIMIQLHLILALVKEIPDSCYPVVGCFSNKEPWITASRPVMPPQHPKDVSTSMTFFSKQALTGMPFTVYPEIDMSAVPFDPMKPTVAVYHCYLGNATAPWLIRIKDAYLERADANVVLVEWRMASKNHAQAVSDARVLGMLVALALVAARVDPASLHLIGFCVGANAASYTAKYLAETGKRPARLVALSPIWRFFDNSPDAVRIVPDDADFVVALHTDMAGAGTAQQPVGHIDFYFNGGFKQPWCPVSDRMAVKTCSHSFAHEIYAEALESNCLMGQLGQHVRGSNGELVEVKTTAVDCKNSDCMPVGMNLPPSARGIYTVVTNPAPSYCIPVKT